MGLDDMLLSCFFCCSIKIMFWPFVKTASAGQILWGAKTYVLWKTDKLFFDLPNKNQPQQNSSELFRDEM